MYNQYNLKADTSSYGYLSKSSNRFEEIILIFKLFLNNEMISKGSIRSYLSDTRQFLNWIFNFLIESKSVKSNSNLNKNINELLKYITEPILNTYKEYLELNNIPTKTINRRFSALRRFGAFCQNQKWCNLNPFDTLRNISLNTSFSEDKYHLGEFKVNLWKENASKLTIKNYLSDVKQFLLWQKKSEIRNPKHETNSND
ncbi:hypothetical protein COT64_00065 [Candidatus Shapirobacteria bacterium CG09_land_8_20_14_0_10_39_12]|uniref:Core-binding (CB) domain-containing protein n=1 Tax=Candidatus Shapirobacteria bacterium CG09_land_8_20_14_0_10_39_12 TaxID=1974885 RepID=A0A2H0WQI3_9BACT|nr:MAG: hypothetical protein COT64_00065 [Candidatus Shapirobacteria bacterium CG09_land_8_20_14_0_10_39_12]